MGKGKGRQGRQGVWEVWGEWGRINPKIQKSKIQNPKSKIQKLITDN
jgi:hypothetical protein